MTSGISSGAEVEFPAVTWTSFDRYARYGAIARAIRANLGPGRHTVLDVGDCAGHLAAFDPELRVIGLDLTVPTEILDHAVPVRGDGTALPFADQSFDAVVSSDVLEHVPAPSRHAFLAELRRVSRDLIIVGAPFATPGVAGVEEVVRRYAALALGAPQPQLEEHMGNGLPDLDDTIAVLREERADVAVGGNGNLWDWLAFMLLRFQLEARPALKPLSDGYDIFYNSALAGRSDTGPFYRRIVVARRLGRAVSGHVDDGSPDEPFPVALFGALVAADGTEAARQDTVPLLHRVLAELIAVQSQLDHVNASLEALDHRIGRAEEMLVPLVPLHRMLLDRTPPGLRRRVHQLLAAMRALLTPPR